MDFNGWANQGSYEYNHRLFVGLTQQLPHERWSHTGRDDLQILKRYIKFSFEKLWEDYEEAEPQDKAIWIYEDDEKAYFNTGLFDRNWQQIFAFFILNQRSDRPDSRKWFLKTFANSYSLSLNGINVSAMRRPNFFVQSSELVFDARYPIIPQWNHILDEEENYSRIPGALRNLGKTVCRNAIQASIERIQQRQIDCAPRELLARTLKSNFSACFFLTPVLYLTHAIDY
jgi:hypothetical protein